MEKDPLRNPKNMRTVKHGKEEENYHCRQCNFSDVCKSGALVRAKNHCKKTSHTVDVYYETWREVTCYKEIIPKQK